VEGAGARGVVAGGVVMTGAAPGGVVVGGVVMAGAAPGGVVVGGVVMAGAAPGGAAGNVSSGAFQLSSTPRFAELATRSFGSSGGG